MVNIKFYFAVLSILFFTLSCQSPKHATSETENRQLAQAGFSIDNILAQQFFPSSFIDLTGFHGSSNVKFNMNKRMPIIPMVPVIKNRSFLGVTTPPHYVGVNISKKTKTQSYSIYTNTVSSSNLLANDPRVTQNPLMQQFKALVEEQGLRFVISPEGRPVGVDPSLNIIYSSSTSKGVGIKIGGSRKNSVTIGDVYNLGAQINFTPNSGRIGVVSGFNVTSQFNLGLSALSDSYSGDKANRLARAGIAFTQVMQDQFISNARGGLRTPNNSSFQAVKRSQITLPTPNTRYQLAMDNLDDSLSSKFKNKYRSLKSNLNKEMQLKNKLQGYINQVAVTRNQLDHKLIQNICDHIAAGFGFPAQIWPRCAIQATLVPNAFAHAGGNIFITAGLIGVLPDVDALAFVLAHEMGHVLARHLSKSRSGEGKINFLATGLSVISMGYSLGGGLGTLGGVTLGRWFPQMLKAQFLAGNVSRFSVLTAVAGFMAFSRAQELEADQLGQEIAFATGANMQGMHAGWASYADFINRYMYTPANIKSAIFATHPNSETRQRKIARNMSRFESKLTSHNQSNGFPNAWANSYYSLHRKYKSAVHAWGRSIKAKNSNNPKAHAASIAAMFGPGSRCAHFALGGAKDAVFWNKKSIFTR